MGAQLQRHRRKSGNRGHRLNKMTTRTPEMIARQQEVRATQPVTRRFVDPTPKLARPDLPVTQRQLDYLTHLAGKVGEVAPYVTTRLEASTEIGRFKGVLAARRDIPAPRRRRRQD